jgi:hypothetical protein
LKGVGLKASGWKARRLESREAEKKGREQCFLEGGNKSG